MPRLMSVAFTEDAVRSRIKTVTRRKGWTFLKPGERLTLCRKVMGRQGAPLVRVAEVEVVAVTREPLSAITAAEVALEGFPGMEPAEFIRRFFTEAQGITADAEVTRIEWKYTNGSCRVCGEEFFGTELEQATRFLDHWEALHEATYDERHGEDADDYSMCICGLPIHTNGSRA